MRIFLLWWFLYSVSVIALEFLIWELGFDLKNIETRAIAQLCTYLGALVISTIWTGIIVKRKSKQEKDVGKQRELHPSQSQSKTTDLSSKKQKKPLNDKQKIVIAITVPLALIPIGLKLATEISDYGPFEWKETWFIWAFTFLIIGFIEYKLFESK